jgi:hypothetical protein
MVEPVDPFQGGELDGFERAPGPPPVDHLGLVEAINLNSAVAGSFAGPSLLLLNPE